MLPSHPRPEELVALAGALSAAGEHAATAGEELLDHMVTVGDHATQTAVDDLVDAAVDALRELSANCRELSVVVSAGSASNMPVRPGEAAPLRDRR